MLTVFLIGTCCTRCKCFVFISKTIPFNYILFFVLSTLWACLIFLISKTFFTLTLIGTSFYFSLFLALTILAHIPSLNINYITVLICAVCGVLIPYATFTFQLESSVKTEYLLETAAIYVVLSGLYIQHQTNRMYDTRFEAKDYIIASCSLFVDTLWLFVMVFEFVCKFCLKIYKKLTKVEKTRRVIKQMDDGRVDTEELDQEN